MVSVIGYLHVGPLDHNADFQRDLLLRHGAERVFADDGTEPSRGARAELSAALDVAEQGDTLLVWRMDRLGSSTSSVLSLIEMLLRRGIGVSSIAEKFRSDESTASAVIGAFAELDRQLQRNRALTGAYTASARGRRAGRPRALSDRSVERVLALRDQGASVREIAEELGTSRATIYRAIEGAMADAGDEPEPPRSLTIALPGRPAEPAVAPET